MSREDWDGWKEGKQEKRKAQLAESDTSGWKECTPWHYQKMIGHNLINWWPSSRRWQYKGKMYYGTAEACKGFVKNKTMLAERERRDG